MVCNRCVMVVQQVLEKMKLKTAQVRLGEIDLVKMPTSLQLKTLSNKLQELGFELLDDQRKKQIEKIKRLLIRKVQAGDIEEHFSISQYLAGELNREYSSLSRLFSEVEGITIEQFFILQKIEKAKELLVYGEMNLNEISYHLGYSSVAHLSAQFKKITGLSSRDFRNTGSKRKPLDTV